MFLPRREVTATGTLVLKCSWLKKTVVWEIIRVVNDGMNVFISSLMKSRRNLMKKKSLSILNLTCLYLLNLKL